MCAFLRGLTTWKVMPRNVWNEIVSWQTGRLNKSTKCQLHGLTTLISKKKNWNLQETCQKFGLKLFWNAFTWHILANTWFCGHWTNLHDPSQNRPKRATNNYLVWSLTFVIHVITNSIVMWETLQNNAEWECFITPILREILRTQNLLLVENYGVFGSHTFVPISWMCKKQTSVSHGSTESEIISLGAGSRMDHILALDKWDLTVTVLHGNTHQNVQVRGDPYKSQTKKESQEWSMICSTLFLLLQTWILLGRKLCCIFWKTTKQWSRWSEREEVRQWDNPQSCSWLVVWFIIIWTPRSKSNTLTPNINSQTYWPTEISHVMNGIICCACSTSAISIPSMILKRCREENKKMQVKRVTAKSKPMDEIGVTIPREWIRTCLSSPEKQNLNVGTNLWVRYMWSKQVRRHRIKLFSKITITPLNRASVRLRKMLDRFPEDAMQDIDKRFMIWWMFMSSTLEPSVFMWWNYSDNVHSIKNTGENLTLKQMSEISEKMILEQSDETLLECLKSTGKILYGNNYFWSMMKKLSVSRIQRFVYFQILCYVSESWIRTKHPILFEDSSWVGSKIHDSTEFWTQLT